MERFEIDGKNVTVYPSVKADRPIIYLNTFEDMGTEVYDILRARSLEFTLVAIVGLDWNSEMPPWDIPPISANSEPFTGGADEYIKLLTERIVPKAESFAEKISLRGIAGYSLAGLFAVYSLYRTDIFSRAASVSGSLWFPRFKEFVFENEMKKLPDLLYFSVGDKEAKTRNKYMKTVRENTEAIEKFYHEKGINTCFELNRGDHFQNAAERTANGVERLLSGA